MTTFTATRKGSQGEVWQQATIEIQNPHRKDGSLTPKAAKAVKQLLASVAGDQGWVELS